MRAIQIDPVNHQVKVVDVLPEEVVTVLGSERTETLDLDRDHCLVIGEGGPDTDHPSRFHFTKGAVRRPFFGPVLVLGLLNGNWTDATVELKELQARIVWEVWDEHKENYAVPVG